MPFQTATPELSDDFKNLTQRERDLSKIAAETDPEKKLDPAEIAEMWRALASDYADEAHDFAAERCRRRADRLTWT